jgi:hypothetical protein
LLLVPKQDLYGGKKDWRVCFDARSINEQLKPDTYGIPRIKELFQRVHGFNYCSSLDLVSAYHQLKVRKSDRDILSFYWKGKRFRFVGAPFGLANLPGQFQRLMNCVLAEHYEYVLIYLDDVFIFSKDLESHIQHCKKVIEALTEWKLRLRRGKCHFGFREAVLLGHIISGTSIRADPRKVETFSKLRSPTTGKQLQALLGFASYLRDYIPSYSSIAAPLEAIKNTKVLTEIWTNEHEKSLQLLKDVLYSSVILSMPNHELPFKVATDSSQFGVGAVLYQEEDDKIFYIQFFAKALSKGQINYPATKRELLAIVLALKAFRYYLIGKKFELYTDHKSLIYLFTAKEPSYMLLNWFEQLSEFQFVAFHRPGIEMVLPDALSRLFDNFKLSKGGSESDVSDCISVNVAKVVQRCATCKGRVARGCSSGLCKHHCLGCGIHPVVAQSSNAEQLEQEWLIDDVDSDRLKSLFKEFAENVVKKRIPTEEEQKLLVKQEHEFSHASTSQMFTSLFRKGWYWQTMKSDCSKTANSCPQCLRFNIVRQGYHPLTTITASLPFDHIAIDLAQPSGTSQDGNNFILVITDICTRFTILKAIPDKTALTVARWLYQTFCDFGLPKIVQSDNGTEFVNAVLKKMKKHCAFSHRLISSYHPQANGVAEAHVKLAKTLLTKYVNGDWSEWCKFVPMVQLSINNRITARHHSTPFSLMFTRRLNEPRNDDTVESAPLTESQLIERNSQIAKILFPTIDAVSQSYSGKMANDFNLSHKIISEGYPTGAMVMKRVDVKAAKGNAKYEGPFKVLEKTKYGTYALLDATGALYQKRVPADHLKLISVPDHTLEEESYEVEKILKHRGNSNNREYYVSWKGYSKSSNSWVKADDFDSLDIIDEYWKSQSQKGKKTQTQTKKKK